jgi:nicotinamide-nucleotide amidase
VAEALDDAIPDDVDDLAHQVLESACIQDLTLATAESCTGGLLASLLTDIPGRSHAFDRGFVVYATEAKTQMLGVPAALLDDPGPVSEVVARLMAEGAIRHSSADIAVSITGFAGRGEPGDPAGRVHFACARRGGGTIHRHEEFGDIGRARVRIASLRTALQMMRHCLQAATNSASDSSAATRAISVTRARGEMGLATTPFMPQSK